MEASRGITPPAPRPPTLHVLSILIRSHATTDTPDQAAEDLNAVGHETTADIHAYRNLGIFYENAVNRILHDVVKACRPVWVKVTDTFTARGGLSRKIEAKYP